MNIWEAPILVHRYAETHALYVRSKGRENETDGTTVQKITQGWIPPRRNNDFMMKYISTVPVAVVNIS